MVVRGFKALQRLDLTFPGKMLILVGCNGAGKSSALQAAAFLQYFIKGQPERFFEDRGWAIGDIRSKVDGQKGTIGFNIHLDVGAEVSVAWGFTWSIALRELESESIYLLHNSSEVPVQIIGYSRAAKSVDILDDRIKGIKSPGSVLSIIDTSSLDDRARACIDAVKNWALGVFSLELLSPAAMRRGNRGANTDIGPRGERLGGFLASLPPEKKRRLMARMSSFYPVTDVETTKKKAGWIDLKVAEAYPGLGKISAAHMSDGFMRLLGLASIPEFGREASMVLLDEIEDGVEPHILADFIHLISHEADAQMLLTSHSPVLVNRFEPEEICFIARARDGRTIAAGFHEIEEMQTGLEYFGTGEIWSQTSMEAINKLVRNIAEKKDKEYEEYLKIKPLAARVRHFMRA